MRLCLHGALVLLALVIALPIQARMSAASLAGDHSTCDKAVIITADNENDGVATEHQWTAQHYPGSRWREQALQRCPKSVVDHITLDTINGPVEIMFGIDSFYGKL